MGKNRERTGKTRRWLAGLALVFGAVAIVLALISSSAIHDNPRHPLWLTEQVFSFLTALLFIRWAWLTPTGSRPARVAVGISAVGIPVSVVCRAPGDVDGRSVAVDLLIFIGMLLTTWDACQSKSQPSEEQPSQEPNGPADLPKATSPQDASPRDPA